ncbi:hypothetical protein PRIPAC_72514 [Pristionchus pacificus]|uniref:Uncharacterized protein n=1 Tax=Pristionchus pacificus TaxID=54126 RepID=A0A2A6CA71_PRIPA|nr:hypothetical protein PRIPAC_72514 [Pristionchus pacificus]|eukprot:PDM75027.1 hypothetical protein PRIPAC_40408 [Pristionchus pacificus]
MRLFFSLLLLSFTFVNCDKDEDSLWEELKRKAPLAFQMLKDKVSEAVEEWRDKEEDYSNKENTDEMLCEIDEDDDQVHKILKKLEKKDDKFKKLVKKIKKFFKARKDALDCSKTDSEGDECLCEDKSNEAFCFLESILLCSKGRYTKSEKEWRERCIALSLDPDKTPKPTKEEWERARNYESADGETKKPKNSDGEKYRERAIMDKLGIDDGSAGNEELKMALEKDKRKRRDKNDERRAKRYEEKCKRRDERAAAKKEKEVKKGSKKDSGVSGTEQTDVEMEGGTTGITEGATTGVTEIAFCGKKKAPPPKGLERASGEAPPPGGAPPPPSKPAAPGSDKKEEKKDGEEKKEEKEEEKQEKSKLSTPSKGGSAPEKEKTEGDDKGPASQTGATGATAA